MSAPVDLATVLAGIEQPWQPHTVALLNDYDVRVARMQGKFPRHTHPDTDEAFLVLSGSLTIRMDDEEVTLGPGQLYVVPRGVPHAPYAPDGAEALMVEPSLTVNTGDNPGEYTQPRRMV